MPDQPISDPSQPGSAAPIPWFPPLPRWRRITCPPGVLPAAGITGLAGAALIPLDRPGIGWVLAGSVAAAAVLTVDRRARRAPAARGTAESTPDSSESVEASSPGPAMGERVGFGVLQWNWGRVWWVALGLGL
ncbi:hypothetical protein ACHQ4I_21860, partial [Nocardia nepalensis]